MKLKDLCAECLLTVSEYAGLEGISERCARKRCANGLVRCQVPDGKRAGGRGLDNKYVIPASSLTPWGNLDSQEKIDNIVDYLLNLREESI